MKTCRRILFGAILAVNSFPSLVICAKASSAHEDTESGSALRGNARNGTDAKLQEIDDAARAAKLQQLIQTTPLHEMRSDKQAAFGQKLESFEVPPIFDGLNDIQGLSGLGPAKTMLQHQFRALSHRRRSLSSSNGMTRNWRHRKLDDTLIHTLCNELVECASDWSIADASVFFKDEYDELTSITESYTAATGLDASQSDGMDIKLKMNNITEAIADAEISDPDGDRTQCDALLDEFHGVTLDEVCEGRYNYDYISFTEIDTDLSGDGKTSYFPDSCYSPGNDACEEFIVCARNLYNIRPSSYASEEFPFGDGNDASFIPIGLVRDEHGLPEVPIQYNFVDWENCTETNLESCNLALEVLFGQETSVGSVCEVASRSDEADMPGDCCLDKPSDRVDDAWGTSFSCLDDGIDSCQTKGPWFSRTSEAACKQIGGTWCPRPCNELQECLESSDSDEIPHNLKSITDARDYDACKQVRDFFLGYDYDVSGKPDDSYYDNKEGGACEIIEADYSRRRLVSSTSSSTEEEEEDDCQSGLELAEEKFEIISGEVLQRNTSNYQEIYLPILIAERAVALATDLAEHLKDALEEKFPPGTVLWLLLKIAHLGLEATVETYDNFDGAMVDRWAYASYQNLLQLISCLCGLQECVRLLRCPYVYPNNLNPDFLDNETGQFQFIVRGQGCDGVDQDCDGISDECKEDQVKPEIILPPNLQSQVFKDSVNATSHLYESTYVEDDCAYDFDVNITQTNGTCANSTFLISAQNKRCGNFSTIADENVTEAAREYLLDAHIAEEEVTLYVDEAAPNVSCGFARIQEANHTLSPGAPPAAGEPLYISPAQSKDEGPLLDIGFWYTAQDNCAEKLKVDITLKSNELQGFPPYLSMGRIVDLEDEYGEPSFNIFLSPSSCLDFNSNNGASHPSDPILDGNCKTASTDLDPHARVFDINVRATDDAGWMAEATCTVIAVPSDHIHTNVTDLVGEPSKSSLRYKLFTKSLEV